MTSVVSGSFSSALSVGPSVYQQDIRHSNNLLWGGSSARVLGDIADSWGAYELKYYPSFSVSAEWQKTGFGLLPASSLIVPTTALTSLVTLPGTRGS